MSSINEESSAPDPAEANSSEWLQEDRQVETSDLEMLAKENLQQDCMWGSDQSKGRPV